MNWILAIALIQAVQGTGVREVKATGCDIIRVNVSLGMTTVLDLADVGEPSLTLHADEEHFILRTHENAKRSIAILPQVSEADLRRIFHHQDGVSRSESELAQGLDRSFRTNLFVFFKTNQRLMFQLRFVPKAQADYVLRIKPEFRKECHV